jgi:hypothetical protein
LRQQPLELIVVIEVDDDLSFATSLLTDVNLGT